jgi:hypothetical protein
LKGEMVARVAGKTEKQEGTGKCETLNVERAFAWTNDGNYLGIEFLGKGISWGPPCRPFVSKNTQLPGVLGVS